jgi:hypothetical protein
MSNSILMTFDTGQYEFQQEGAKFRDGPSKISTTAMILNSSKSIFFAEQIEYRDCWFTRQSIQSVCNKVEAILKIKASKTKEEEQTTSFYWYSQLRS